MHKSVSKSRRKYERDSHKKKDYDDAKKYSRDVEREVKHVEQTIDSHMKKEEKREHKSRSSRKKRSHRSKESHEKKTVEYTKKEEHHD